MLALFRSNENIWFSVWNNSTSNPYMVPECAYAVDANTLFERCPKTIEKYKYALDEKF
ncbi:MAG: hypothetical protein QXK37_01400 [Candidatus Woesearchaeota archaeon]